MDTMRAKPLASGSKTCLYCGQPATLSLVSSTDENDGETKLIRDKIALVHQKIVGQNAASPIKE